MSGSLLVTENLAVTIAGQTIVHGLNLHLQPGERLVILGRNGVGKTMLLQTLAGLRAPHAGTIYLQGKLYRELGPRGAARLRGFLTQRPVDTFATTVLETVLIGRYPHGDCWAGWESAADIKLAYKALRAVGMADFHHRVLHTLSGGERQRVALATLLVQQPQLYLLDEPLAYLDLQQQIAVLELFKRCACEDSAAVIMVLHDINLAIHYADQALLLFGNGTNAFGPVATLLNPEYLNLLYGHPLRTIRDGKQYWLVPDI